MIEIELSNNGFLRVKETLTRMGIANQRNKVLYQSCHILKKFNKYKNKDCYYIIHFKELMALDGKEVQISEEDYSRTYSIAKTLETWGLVDLVDDPKLEILNNFRVIKASQTSEWTLKSKYVVGQ